MNDPLCKVSSFISMHDGQMWPHYMKWNVCVGKKNASVFPHRWWWWGWFKLCGGRRVGDTHWSVVSCQDWVTGIFRRRGRTHEPAVKGNDCACRAHCNSAAASCQLRPRHLGKRGTVVKNHFCEAPCALSSLPVTLTDSTTCALFLNPPAGVQCSPSSGTFAQVLLRTATLYWGDLKRMRSALQLHRALVFAPKTAQPPSPSPPPSIIDPPPLNVFLQAHAASPQSLCLTVTVEG